MRVDQLTSLGMLPNVIKSLVGRLISAHPNHKRIAAGAALIGVLMTIAKVFVAAREVAIAWRYGVSGTVDAYQLAVTITTWLPMLLSGVISVVLVPSLVRLKRHCAGRKAFVSELNGNVLVLGGMVVALTWITAIPAARLLASGTELRTLTAVMTSAMAPAALLMVVCGYLSARLQARQRYGYSVTEAVPAFVITMFVIGPLGSTGVAALVEGTLIGYLLQLVALVVLARQGDAPLGSVRFRRSSDEWTMLQGSFLLMIGGQLLFSASIPIDQGFAARLGEGSVATLGYATRVVTLFTGIGTIVVGRALLPVLSEAVADGNLSLGRHHSVQWAWLLGGVATIGTVVLWFFIPDLVRLLFQRGAFTATASVNVSNVLRFGLLQIPFYFAGIALMQWYAATARFKEVLLSALAALCSKIVLNALLVQAYGLPAIMVSTAAMYLVMTGLLALRVRNLVPAN